MERMFDGFQVSMTRGKVQQATEFPCCADQTQAACPARNNMDGRIVQHEYKVGKWGSYFVQAPAR